MKTESPKTRTRQSPSRRRGGPDRKSEGLLKIRNVLVPLDFSSASHAAVRFASPLSKHFAANLHLVHVLPPDSPASGLADLPLLISDAEVGRRVRRDLGKVAQNQGLRIRPGRLHVRKGVPFVEICALARAKAVDLIVVATRGITGLKHLLLGSTAERVVRYSPCPILVVHNWDRPEASKDGAKPERESDIRTILVPVDFSDPSARNLNYATELAKEFDATLVLLHSVAPQYPVTDSEYARYDLPSLMRQAEKAAKEQMADLVAQTSRKGVRAKPSLQIGHPGQHICEQAMAERADLIITSTHGRTGLKHVLIGSTAEYVVRHAKTPVLVVPSHDRPIPR